MQRGHAATPDSLVAPVVPQFHASAPPLATPPASPPRQRDSDGCCVTVFPPRQFAPPQAPRWQVPAGGVGM